MKPFVAALREGKSAAFDLEGNSSAGRVVEIDLWGKQVELYANANFSIYSGQACNARCSFCVEELRPVSRGRDLARTVEADDGRYFSALEAALRAVSPLGLTISVTGGEPSKDPRLGTMLALAQKLGGDKRTITTNGSGLFDPSGSGRVIDRIAETGVKHLNLSRAHPDQATNARLMQLSAGLEIDQLAEAFAIARGAGVRPRLSCVLIEGAIDDLPGILAYLDFARSIGVDNVIFRQLMLPDRQTVRLDRVVRYTDRHRARLEPILDRLSNDERFCFVQQIVGYYYYVEVFRFDGMDVVFEEADLGHLEREKRAHPGRVHELVFHPNARLCSTWQPWDGDLGPS